MGTFNGVPVRETDSGNLVTERGGWGFSDDENFPGDVIEWPPALGDPRYLEHFSQFTEGVEEQPLILAVLDPDHHVQPCAFCTPAGAVAERGILDSDYELRTLDGELVAYSCHACIADASNVEVDDE